MENEPLAFGEEHEPSRKFGLRHPCVSLFHVLFRTLSVVIYLFCGFSNSGFIGSFVTIVLLVSIDFWVVKNISGRIMVGLRWWNYIDEEGESHWVFESRKGDWQARVSSTEVQIFWVALVATPIVWIIFFLLALLKMNLKWVMIICIAFILSSSNLYGYVKCKLGKSQGITGSVKNFAAGLMQKQMVSNMTSYFTRTPPSTQPSSTI